MIAWKKNFFWGGVFFFVFFYSVGCVLRGSKVCLMALATEAFV